MFLQTRVLEAETRYDGLQLSPHWIYKTAGIQGNALIAFTGEADVSVDHLVDQEDAINKAHIYSPKMLHFLAEWFIDSLDQGILLQHLFTCEIYESLLEKGVNNLRKRGNDIYYDDRKMSVSIATRSGVSVLMHTAVNVDTQGTPVPTAGLRELGIDPRSFGQEILARFCAQSEIWAKARVKVSPRL